MGEHTAEVWGQVAASIPGWDLAEGMVGWVDGQRCVVIGPDDRPEPARRGPWQVMPCSGEWESSWNAVTFMARSIRADEFVLDPDASGSTGCLLVLLGPGAAVRHDHLRGDDPNAYTAWVAGYGRGDSTTAGRAIISLAKQFGCWPGGAP